MATSSIFHNIIISDSQKADAFLEAIEASIADPYKRAEAPIIKLESDSKNVNHILNLWKKELF